MKFIENTTDKVIKTLRKSSIFPKIFFIKPADMHTKGNISNFQWILTQKSKFWNTLYFRLNENFEI